MELLARHKSILKVNSRGMIGGLITENEEFATKIVFFAVSRGVLPVWTHRNSIKLAPPLTMTEDVIFEAFATLDEAISEVDTR